jgi:pyruvate dehydrogenase E1 component alpha subunit
MPELYVPEMFQILAPDGSVNKPELVPDMETVEKLYRQMVRVRYFDDRLFSLAKQNKMGTYPLFGGQEASQVGSAMALGPGDYIAPMYRSTGACMAFGWEPRLAIMYWRGHPEGWRIPDHLNMLPIIIDIAAQFPHAAGVAMGLKMQGKPNVAMSWIGEGGTSQGDFHAGVNWAAATESPAVFIIENNGWAISVPRAVQSKVDHLMRRADGYGIPGYLVDGNDVLAVHHIASKAVEDARAGKGASLIEQMTYRIRPHTTGDDPKAYRTEDEANDYITNKAPIDRVRKFMTDQKVWDQDREAALKLEVETEFAEALEAADNAPLPDPMALLDYAMANPAPNLLRQREILESRIKAVEHA